MVEKISQEHIANLVKMLRLTITNLRIYPSTSAIVTTTLSAFYNAITAVLDTVPSITFSYLADKLMINGIEPQARDIQMSASAIIKLFGNARIQSLLFKKGLTSDELSDFITEFLTKKKDEFSPYPHIALDQTVYVATIKGEEAVVKITDTIKNSGGDIVGLIKSVRESYDFIDQIPDPSMKEQLQDHMAHELAQQDTAVLRDIFDRELPQKLEQSGLKKRLLNALSKEKIQDIFGDIAKWYEEIRKAEGSDFAAVEQLEKLKSFLHTVLMAPAAKEFPRQFFEDLMSKGLINEMPKWLVQGADKPTTVFEVERLLEKQPLELLDDPVRDSIPGLVERLCQIENNELILKLTEKLLANLKNNSPKIRLLAAQTASLVYTIVASLEKEHIVKYMELPLLECAEKESSADVYLLLADLLRKRAVKNLLYGIYEPVTKILQLLRTHSLEEMMPVGEIRATARESLKKLLGELLDILVGDLKSDNEKKRSGSIQILAMFGPQSIDPLIRVIKESADLRSRKLAAGVLKSIGEPAQKRFIEELNLGLTAEEIKHVIEVLPIIEQASSLDHLHILLRYPDAEVKKCIIRFLAHLKTGQAKALLLEQLKDGDYAVVAETARILSDLRYNEAAPLFIALLNAPKTPVDLQEELCIYLGMLQDQRAIAPLIAKLNKTIYWFTKNQHEIERVQMRAAWALRKFSGAAVKAALEKASKKKNDSIALTAKESLELLASPARQDTGAH